MKRYRIDAIEQIMCEADKDGKSTQFTPTITTVLKEAVNPDALAYAVAEAMAFHPYFATRLIKEEGLFYWQENNRTPILSELSILDGFSFGDQSNHYFPWRVTYFENTIYFNFAHELVDASGALTFHTTLMEYYTRYIRGDSSRIAEKTTREERIESETALPSDIGYREGAKALLQPREKKGSPFRADKLSVHRSIRSLSIDLPLIRQIAFGFDASPFALIAPILARALLPYLEGEHKILKLSLLQDTRGHFNSQTLHNSILQHYFYYDDDVMRKMPIEQVATLFRSRLDLLSDVSNAEAASTALHQLNQVIHLPEVREQTLKFMTEYWYDPSRVTYSHITRLGLSEQAREQIADVYHDIANHELDVSFLAINYGDQVNLMIASQLSDDAFVADICAQFEALQVRCTVNETRVLGERYFMLNTTEEDLDESCCAH